VLFAVAELLVERVMRHNRRLRFFRDTMYSVPPCRQILDPPVMAYSHTPVKSGRQAVGYRELLCSQSCYNYPCTNNDAKMTSVCRMLCYVCIVLIRVHQSACSRRHVEFCKKCSFFVNIADISFISNCHLYSSRDVLRIFLQMLLIRFAST